VNQLMIIAADLVAVSVLAFGLYFPRHHRRDLVVAFLGVNIGVLAVAQVLATTEVGLGIGLGLFGVLSIIRLRSTELDQHEVAYYFSALALGILGPLSSESGWLGPSLMGLILVIVYLADHPRLLRSYKRQVMVLDSAITDPVALTAQLERVLGARVHSATIERTDLVNETTVVEVRYSYPRKGSVRSSEPALAGAHR